MSERADLTVVIPAWNEEENLSLLLPLLNREMEALGVREDITVADHEARDGTGDICRRDGARLLKVSRCGYGRALVEAFAVARGEFVLTMRRPLPPVGIREGSLGKARQCRHADSLEVCRGRQRRHAPDAPPSQRPP